MARLAIKRAGRLGGRPNESALSRKANSMNSKRRQSKSAKAMANVAQDVYDYEPTKNRRQNISLAFDEDDIHGVAYDDDDDLDEEDSRLRRRPRLIGEGEDDERIGSDEDEEIDSEAAFDESDEEQFAGSNFKKRKLAKLKKRTRKEIGKRVKIAEVDLDEDDDGMQSGVTSQDSEDESEEEEEEGEDNEFLDVLDVLDGRAKPFLRNEGESPESKKDQPQVTHDLPNLDGEANEHEDEKFQKEEDEGEDEDEDEESEDENRQISASEEDEEDIAALDALDSFVSGLETGAKRKASDQGEEIEDDETVRQAKKKKRLLKDRTESGVENEFNASAAVSSKLSLDDLLTPLASKQGELATLKKSIKPLADSSKNQPLPAPLPTRTQEKLEREAAYEQTKQEVDKWTDTMKRIQEAEHLSFPLQAFRGVKVSNLELTAKFKPTTEMESSIDRLLKSAKLHEEEINKTEDLMMKDLSVEEVVARRAELRKMRELAFRADAKAKRIAKIKSKTYRRIRKKERAKLMAKLDTSGTNGEVDEEEERLRAETERARERATLRHKNTGKWAKAMKGRGELDADQRRDINEMLERGERLRRRIQGVGSGDEGDTETSDSDEDVEGEDGVMRLKANAFEEIRKIQEEGEEQENGEGKQKAKSVFQMKFMKDAAARRNASLDREIDDFRREMGDMPEGSDKDDIDTDSDAAGPAERLHGRMVFRPGPRPQASLMLPPPPASAISETSTLRSHDSAALSPVLTAHEDSGSTPPPASASSIVPTTSEPSNPWLVETSSSSKITRRKNELIVGKNVTRAQRSEAAMQKQSKKGVEERENERDDARVEINADDVLLLESTEKTGDTATATDSAAKEGKKKKGKKRGKKEQGERGAEQQREKDDSETNSETEEQEAALKKGRKLTAFQQRELVSRAFAGDNVVRQFADEKRKEIEADAPHEVDTTLQGWGSWGGAGIKKTGPKPHLIKKVAGIDPKSRADYGKAHVIISERRDKKALKFAVKDLPYPYTSKAQFEARMSTPVGVEWNTRLAFQRETLPRVVKKMGTIIDPLEQL